MSYPPPGGVAWSRRSRAAGVGLGAVGLLAAAPAVVAGLTDPGPRVAAAQPHPNYPDRGCGSNRDQVLL